MARSDNPQWNLTKQYKYRIPKAIKDPAEGRIAWLKAAGYEIDDTFNPGEIDLAKYIRHQLVLLATETPEESVARLRLTQKTGAGK